MKMTVQKHHRSHKSSLNSKGRVYFGTKGATVLEMLQTRYSHPYKYYKTLMPQVFADAGLPTDTKFKWSQKAGCRCGCSPGFILPDERKIDLYVTLEDDGVAPFCS